METRRFRLTRRDMLHWLGMGAAGAILAACAPKAQPTAEPTKAAAEATKAPATAAATMAPTETPVPVEATATPKPTPAPRDFGSGGKTIWINHQEYQPINVIMDNVIPTFAKKYPEYTFTVQPSDSNMSKILPMIAAGTEPDVMNQYVSDFLSTDITKIFLDITEQVGGRKGIEERVFSCALDDIDTPGGHVYFVPWGCGIGGVVVNINSEHAQADGIDYDNIQTLEELVEAGIKLTRKEGDKISRVGLTLEAYPTYVLHSLIWQLGGEFYDRETGKFDFATPEAEAAAQFIYDLYWKHGCSSFDLYGADLWTASSTGLASMYNYGAWAVSTMSDLYQLKSDGFAIPKLANAKEYVVDPGHFSLWACSRRLANDPEKANVCVELALKLTDIDSALVLLDVYSGTMLNKTVYDDPRIEGLKWGPVSKKLAMSIWPNGRYAGHHVGQAIESSAEPELIKGYRKEVPLKEALANYQRVLQDGEDQARERLGI